MTRSRVPGPSGLASEQENVRRPGRRAQGVAGPAGLEGAGNGSVSALRARVLPDLDWDLLYEDLVRWEGQVSYMYQDSSATKFKDLAVAKLKRTYVPALRRFFPDFDRYPSPAQRALIDLAYNGGARGTSELALAEHVERREWDQAARKVPVRGNDNRRQWRVEMFEDAAQREAAH